MSPFVTAAGAVGLLLVLTAVANHVAAGGAALVVAGLALVKAAVVLLVFLDLRHAHAGWFLLTLGSLAVVLVGAAVLVG